MKYAPSLITDDFDLSFLLLSFKSARFDDFLNLHDAAANIGLHTTIATHPDQFFRAVSAKRLRVIVIDANPESGLNLRAEIKKLGRLRNVAIILMVDPSRADCTLDSQAGVDVCLPMTVDFSRFHRAVINLVQGHKPITKTAKGEALGGPDGAAKSTPWKAATASIKLPDEPIDNNWIWLCR